MKCDEYQLLASADLDRQLSRNDAANYHAHVEACGPCRTYMAELRQVSLMLQSIRQPDASLDLRPYVRAAIAAK
jgi:predicted anti-sigma-YlaC factor YlaD